MSNEEVVKDKPISENDDEHVFLCEERIEIANGLYVTICSNSLAQL